MLKLQKKPSVDTVTVTFAVPADAGPTSVVGDFNAWDPHAHPMRRRSNGTRSVTVSLPAGDAVRFRYLSEGGRWFDEPQATTNGGDCLIVLPD